MSLLVKVVGDLNPSRLPSGSPATYLTINLKLIEQRDSRCVVQLPLFYVAFSFWFVVDVFGVSLAYFLHGVNVDGLFFVDHVDLLLLWVSFDFCSLQAFVAFRVCVFREFLEGMCNVLGLVRRNVVYRPWRA